LAVLDSRLESARTEERRYDAMIAQKRQSQRIRDSLIAEMGAIRALDGARYVWPHILDQLAKALPPYTWLSSVTFVPMGATPTGPTAAAAPKTDTTTSTVRFTITGNTVDIQAYTTFLRQLAASPWFTGVMPATTMTVTDENRPVTAFTVEVRYRTADSAYMHVVPLVSATP
jgi:Tfp pilus assembly protein PilN